MQILCYSLLSLGIGFLATGIDLYPPHHCEIGAAYKE